MIGFFVLILGFLYYIFFGTVAIVKRDIDDNCYNSKKLEQALVRQRAVYLERYETNYINGQTKYISIYKDSYTNKRVIKANSRIGLKRWYYAQNKMPMQYKYNQSLFDSAEKNIQEMKEQNRLWFVVENYWDDTIYRLTKNRFLFHTYLDDYRATFDPIEAEDWRKLNESSLIDKEFNDINKKQIENIRCCYISDSLEHKKIAEQYFKNNNPLNQKIYKNMYPYQLHLIINITKEAKKTNNWKLVERQYVIRFMKRKRSLYEQMCISDKTHDAIWTKWYSITEEQFNQLTEIKCPYIEKIRYNNIDYCKFYIKDLKPESIAYLDDSQNLHRIAKAFNSNMDFIGEQLL